MSVAFVVFCVLLVAVPQAVRWYLANAMSDRPVRLEVLKGTTFWLPPGARQEVNAANGMQISTGGRLRTATDSKAFLSLFDGSNVQLWPDTTLRVLSSEMTSFNTGNTRVTLAQDQGHARYEVALPVTASRRFEVLTPQANVLLREGSYKIEVTKQQTIVTVSNGSATVSAHDHAVEVLRGEWTKVPDGGTPSRPESSLHNLVVNGSFGHSWEDWQQGSRAVEDNIQGKVSILEEASQTYVEFERSGSEKHGENFIHQALNQDVTDEAVLRLSFQLRIIRQTLSGGGILGSEYPLMVRVHYRDSSGNEQDWLQGFYIQNQDNHPTPNAVSVIPNQWTKETFDLFDPSVVSPKPAEILWIEFTASGHGYQSDVTDVELIAD